MAPLLLLLLFIIYFVLVAVAVAVVVAVFVVVAFAWNSFQLACTCVCSENACYRRRRRLVARLKFYCLLSAFQSAYRSGFFCVKYQKQKPLREMWVYATCVQCDFDGSRILKHRITKEIQLRMNFALSKWQMLLTRSLPCCLFWDEAVISHFSLVRWLCRCI